ncbi:MAG: aldose 1-epimerase [Pirellulales bacterium]
MDGITLRDPKFGSQARIAVDLGCSCYSFETVVDGRRWETLYAHPEFAAGQQRPSGSGIPILFPFPGRLRGDQFEWGGVRYPMPHRDPLGNAIHGAVYTRPWRLVDHTAQEMTAEFQASRDGVDGRVNWPSDYRIRLTYRLAGNSLAARIEVLNCGDARLPYGLGLHPYFRLSPIGQQGWTDVRLHVPVTRRWPLHEMLPTGDSEPADPRLSSPDGLLLDEVQLDDVFSNCARSEDGWARSELLLKRELIRVAVEWDAGWDRCVLFTPPHREAVCIEPYSTLPNAPELESRGVATGWRELAPGECDRLDFRVTVSSFESINDTSADRN